MISVFINVLRVVLWLYTWSILDNIRCALEKNVHSVTFGWYVLCISVNYIGLIFHVRSMFSYWFSVWMIYLHWCKWVINICYYHYIVISPLMSVNIYFICLGAPILGSEIFTILLLDWPLYHYVMSFFPHPFTFILCVSSHLKWVSCSPPLSTDSLYVVLVNFDWPWKF